MRTTRNILLTCSDKSVDGFSAAIQIKLNSSGNLPEEERVDLLTELRVLKKRTTNAFVRMRYGSPARFPAQASYINNVQFGDLSNVQKINAANNQHFSAVNKAVCGMHYTKLLAEVQNQMQSIRATLPDYRIAYTAMANMQIPETRLKLNAEVRKLVGHSKNAGMNSRADVSTNRASSSLQTDRGSAPTARTPFPSTSSKGDDVLQR